MRDPILIARRLSARRLALAAATLFATTTLAPVASAQSSSLATISISGHTAIPVDTSGNPINQSTGFNQNVSATGTGATPANLPLTQGAPGGRVLNYELGAFVRMRVSSPSAPTRRSPATRP